MSGSPELRQEDEAPNTGQEGGVPHRIVSGIAAEARNALLNLPRQPEGVSPIYNVAYPWTDITQRDLEVGIE